MHIIYAYADFINITSTPYGREATRRSAGDGRVGCGRRNHANLVRRQRLLASLTLEERWKVVETQVLDEAVASDHRAIFAVIELLE